MHKGPQLGGRTRVRLMGKVRQAAPFWCIASRCQCTSDRGLTPLRARRPVVSTGLTVWACGWRQAQTVPSSRYIASLVAYAAGQAFRPLALLPSQARCHKGAEAPFPFGESAKAPYACRGKRPWAQQSWAVRGRKRLKAWPTGKRHAKPQAQ